MSYSSSVNPSPCDYFLLIVEKAPLSHNLGTLVPPSWMCLFFDTCPFCLPVHRHWLRIHRHCVPPECVLYCHPGLGHILPIPVLPEGASLGPLQPQLEHTTVLGGHPA